MKPSNLLFACVCFLFFMQCVKKTGPPDQPVLPPVTTEGKNKIGFTIDGKVWLPFHPCPISAWSGPGCGEASVGYLGAGQLYMQFSRANEAKESHLEFTPLFDHTITGPGEKIDSVTVLFIAENDQGTTISRYGDPQPGSTFVISRMDTLNNIISGQFELILTEQNGSGNNIHLKNGRFDFRFPACLCR